MDNKYYIECGQTGKTGSRIRIEYDYIDPDMDDWQVAFKSILTFLTYHPDLIKDMFNEGE